MNGRVDSFGPCKVVSGLKAYDIAVHNDIQPILSNIHVGPSMSSLLQKQVRLSGPVPAVSVPANDSTVLLIRTGRPYAQFCRLAGAAYTLPVDRDYAVLLPAGVDSFWADQTEIVGGWLHFHFDTTVIARAADEFGADLSAISFASSRELRRFADVALDLTEAGPPPALVWDGLSWMILYHLARLIRKGIEQAAATGHRLAPWQARRTIEYMREHLEQDICLADLATVCGVSPFHFARGFRNSVGHPPHRYLVLMRMERARDLLADKRLPIIEIALAVGYDTPQAFARAFRRTIGVSPSTYRADLR